MGHLPQRLRFRVPLEGSDMSGPTKDGGRILRLTAGGAWAYLGLLLAGGH
jgi:hypothetical protein